MDLCERVDNNFDAVLIIESGSLKGTGKSTFSMLLEEEISEIKNFKFDIIEMTVFDPTSEKIVERVKYKPRAYPVHIDEAGKVAYKRNWNKEWQKDLIIFINVCRKHGKIIPLNHPSFWGLDSDLRDIADYRVTILRRGLAIVRGKVANPEAKDKWIKDETEKLINEMVHDKMDVDATINALRRTPNYLFEIHFPEMDQKVYSVYEKMSMEAELESFYAAGQNKYRLGFEGAVGVIKFFMQITDNQYSFTDVTRAINGWIHYRTGVGRSTFTPPIMKDIAQQLEVNGYTPLEFGKLLQKPVRLSAESLKNALNSTEDVGVSDTEFNNKQNTIES